MQEKIANDEIPILGPLDGQTSQGEKVPVSPPHMTNQEIRADFLTFAKAMTDQTNKDVGPSMNVLESTMDSILRDFVRMNPSIFLGSRVGQDPQEFLDGIYKIVDVIIVASREKAELSSYKLKGVG